MTVVGSVHIADVAPIHALRVLRKAPTGDTVDGLRHADVAIAGQLGPSLLPSPTLRRVGLIAFWDDDEAIDRFLAGHPLAGVLAGGWHSRLEPLRAFGQWPGLPGDLTSDRVTGYGGPAVVLTLGRLRIRETVRFLRTSARAEGAAIHAPGVIWATGLARPPFVATCSLWESTEALSTFAYGRRDPAHPDAIEEDKRRAFHKRSVFVRFRPYATEGHLGGRNPLPEAALAS